MPTATPNPFWKVALLLEEAIQKDNPIWRFPFLAYAAGSAAAERAWETAERRQRATIDEFVRQWIGAGRIPPMSDEEMYWFRLRFVAAYAFLYQFGHKDKPPIFPYPKMEVCEVLQWMLLDWWADVGIEEAMFVSADDNYGTRHAEN